MQTKKHKPTLGTQAAYAAVHTNSKLGSDIICHLAEAVAPGFTECIQQRIACRVTGDWDGDIEWKTKAISNFQKGNRRYALVFHLLALWIGIKLTEIHDPYKPIHGDVFKKGSSMTICYYSFYEGNGRVSKIGMVLYVDHAKKEFVFHENAPEGKYPDEADHWIHMRSNLHTLALYDALKNNGYKEIERTVDPHPWSLTDEEKY